MDSRLNGPALALRIAVGLMATLAGLDKFFNLLTNWTAYIAPIALQMSPISPSALMGVVGVVEFTVGLSILVIRPNVGAYVASAWLVLVAINLVLGAHYDIAVRDVVLSVAAFTLARLEEALGHVPAAFPARKTATA
jgi:uncharacterized membrane protein YphA (DoxX/SURF4 family)